MINVLVYVLPNRSGGGYSVVRNLYEDIKAHDYPDIHWYFIVGTPGLESCKKITIVDESRSVRSYLKRSCYENYKLKSFVKKHNIEVVLSLNVGMASIKLPSIVSLHNVLPFYRCDSLVFDRKIDMLKQRIINWKIIKSLKKADYVIVPSNWIRKKLVDGFGIAEGRIIVSPMATPEMAHVEIDIDRGGECNSITRFIYPASGFPYKNHSVIIEAAKLLKQEGINNYYILLSGNVGNGATIQKLRREIEENDLPINFCGLLPEIELLKVYKRGVLIFPSKIETDGFPLLECMACGGYIIAADIDYAREALQNYDNYDLFDADRAEDLKTIMKKVINNGMVPKSRKSIVRDVIPRTEVIVPLVRSIMGKNGNT